jgi:hypothetical protein
MPPQRRSAQRDNDPSAKTNDVPESSQDTEVRGSLPGEASAAEDSTQTQTDGPKIVPGPTGTVVDPNDPSIGTLRVKVNSNVTLGNELRTVGPDTVEVPDTAETRAAIGAGHLSLVEDDGKKK